VVHLQNASGKRVTRRASGNSLTRRTDRAHSFGEHIVWRLPSRLDTEEQMCAASLEGREDCFAVRAGNIILMRNVSSFCEQTQEKYRCNQSSSCGARSCCAQARDIFFDVTCRPSSRVRALFRQSEGLIKIRVLHPELPIKNCCPSRWSD
jgi:hypothetical protein